MNDERIKVIVGHYGSGKTEFALNYAVKLAKTHKKVALADLDVVNPYFRSREKKEMLEKMGVRVIGSNIKNSLGSDLPAVDASALGFLEDEDYQIILDVGGDDVGARALGRYYPYLKDHPYDMFCVVNGNRLQTQTVEGVIEHIRSIERVARISVTGIVNNTHLLRETTLEDVLRGQELVEKVSKESNIPVKYVSVWEKIVPSISQKMEGEIFPIKMFMREGWM